MKKTAQYNTTELALLAGSFIPSFKLLRNNDPLRLAGATAFFTTFALPPIVFILAQIFGLLLSPRTVGQGLLKNLGDNLGSDGAQQIRGVISSIRGFSNSWLVIICGFIFLLFVATTLFVVIKNSFNQIWEVKIKVDHGFLFNLRSRLRSLAIIFLVGILFIADLVFKSLQSISSNYVEKLFGVGSFYYQLVFSEITSIIIVSAWFILLFRFLAEGTPKWKAAAMGGLLTGILFSIGRNILRTLLVKGNIGLLYGTSGSMVLVLLFVFYTSFILYFGASFIKIYSAKKNWPLQREKKQA